MMDLLYQLRKKYVHFEYKKPIYFIYQLMNKNYINDSYKKFKTRKVPEILTVLL